MNTHIAELLEKFKHLTKEEQKELMKMMKGDYYGQDNKMAISNH